MTHEQEDWYCSNVEELADIARQMAEALRGIQRTRGDRFTFEADRAVDEALARYQAASD